MSRLHFHFTIFMIASALLIPSSCTWAGHLYRYKDENGEPVLTRSLPPAYAQKGYEILDDISLRVIEYVPPAPTSEEIINIQKQAALEKENKKRLLQQKIYDKTLLTLYESEDDLIQAWDRLIHYRKTQIHAHQVKLINVEARLLELQKEAADIELSGRTFSENMLKRLDATKQELDLRHQAINDLQAEITSLNEMYAKDLKRLKQLLSQTR